MSKLRTLKNAKVGKHENFEDFKVEHIKFQDNKVEKTLATAYLKTTTT